MSSKITITKPKTMGDVFEKSRKYDALLKENEELKKKISLLESTNDGYREVYEYQNNVIDTYGKLLSELVECEYDKKAAANSAEKLQEVLREVINDSSITTQANDARNLFRDIYNKLYHPNYNPFDDI